MPIYKLTFDDESEAYLAHHGIKGMHWGVWNEETRARRTIAKQVPKQLRASKAARQVKIAKSFRTLAKKDPELNALLDKLHKTDAYINGEKNPEFGKTVTAIGERVYNVTLPESSPLHKLARSQKSSITGKAVVIPEWTKRPSSSNIDYERQRAAIRKAYANPTYYDITE